MRLATIGRRTVALSGIARMGVDDYLEQLAAFTYDGNRYLVTTWGQRQPSDRERIAENFPGVVAGAMKANGVVFAVMLTRAMLFAEARFSWRRLIDGRLTDWWGDGDLDILDRPWPNGSTGELAVRAIQDLDLAGNSYVVRDGDRLRRLRPDWVDIVLDRPSDDPDVNVVGYAVYPGGDRRRPARPFLRNEVAHWSVVADPTATYRGMSWLTPILREIEADSAATTHKGRFFRNAATPNLAVKVDKGVELETFKRFRELIEQDHRGAENAYRTLYLGGGADVTVIGKDFQQLDFRAVQGAGETRIAAAGGVPPVIVGLSEGLQAATYSNYGQARRRLADGTMSPLWRSWAAAMETVVPPPAGSRLAVDTRDIPFLREDAKDAAEIIGRDAQTVRTLIDAGYQPDAVVAAVTAGDLRRLTGQHSGLYSVQLQPPGTKTDPTPTDQPPARAEVLEVP